MRGRWAAAIPITGFVAFVVLTLVALDQFPGGSRFAPDGSGFRLVENFWCDLFDERTFAGLTNPARGWAIAALAALAFGLIPFWWSVLPTLFDASSRLRRPVAVLGSIAMAAGALVPTTLHDPVLLVAGPAAFAAFVLALAGLHRARHKALVATGMVPAVLSTANFALWVLEVGVPAIPVFQKLALATFLVWVAWVTGRVLRQGSVTPHG
jgi:hypothetical protein